jgi:hypothetical protein
VSLLEPHFERRFVAHSYARRRGKGTHAALERAHRLARRFPFVLRGDIVQLFPSIDRGIILKAVVRRSVKDEQFLTVLERVLERVLDLDVVAPPLPHGVQGGPAPAGPVPGRGLPIGNLTARLSRKNSQPMSRALLRKTALLPWAWPAVENLVVLDARRGPILCGDRGQGVKLSKKSVPGLLLLSELVVPVAVYVANVASHELLKDLCRVPSGRSCGLLEGLLLSRIEFDIHKRSLPRPRGSRKATLVVRARPSLGTDHRLTSGLEFLALLVPHIALRYECRLRTYGAISTTIRQELGWIKKDEEPEAPEEIVAAEEDESGFVKLRKKSWARLIAKVYLEDPELCPSCGKKMKVLWAITSPHQDAVIEKILRARGEWDPPWKRQRRARGPPLELEIEFSRSSSIPEDEFSRLGPSEDEYSQERPETENEFSQLAPASDEEL